MRLQETRVHITLKKEEEGWSMTAREKIRVTGAKTVYLND